MMPVEHFLIDIIQILFRDWIENTIANIGRCKAATDIFQQTLCDFLYEHWPTIYVFTVEDAFLFGVDVKIYNVGRLGFFVRAIPNCVLTDTGMFSFACKENIISPPQKKPWFTDTDRKKC